MKSKERFSFYSQSFYSSLSLKTHSKYLISTNWFMKVFKMTIYSKKIYTILTILKKLAQVAHQNESISLDNEVSLKERRST